MGTTIYVDINGDYDVLTNNKELLEDAYAVIGSYINILRTSKGERLFNLQLGTDIPRLLFDPISDEVAYLIQLEMIHAARQEPRCSYVKSLSSIEADTVNQCYRSVVALDISGIGIVSVPLTLTSSK